MLHATHTMRAPAAAGRRLAPAAASARRPALRLLPAGGRARTALRFKEDDRLPDLEQQTQPRKPTDPKLSPQQLIEVRACMRTGGRGDASSHCCMQPPPCNLGPARANAARCTARRRAT